MTPLERIAHRVNRNGDVNDPETPRPLLTVEEFFDGNEVRTSIACSVAPAATLQEVHAVVRRIAFRRDVADLRIEIAMFDSKWPYSDTLWLITNADTEDVVKWFGEYAPDECWVGWTEGVTFEEYPVPDGMRPIACWWGGAES